MAVRKAHPKVEAAVPPATGGTVFWRDDARQVYRAWVPARNVRCFTDSEWDVIEYDRCLPERRPIRWGDRMAGFLPG